MSFSKIHLSEEEIGLVQNAGLLLTKNNIIDKVYTLFGEIAARQTDYSTNHPDVLPREVMAIPPKISKGEKYKGLPYVMLDYPRLFTRDDVFAIRTFFWWGHFFSVTLHLKGRYLQQYIPILENKLNVLSKAGFQLSITGDEWEHDPVAGNFISLSPDLHANIPARLTEGSFYKLCCVVPFSKWNELTEVLSGLQKDIFAAITD